MVTIWLYSLVSVIIVSAISLVGVFTLSLKESILQRLLFYLVSLSVGALLGDVFIHIIPEMGEKGIGLHEGVYLLLGIVFFFILERAILWHHSHLEHEERVHSVVYLIIVGDSFHNFIDGIVIAASFLVSIHLGITATLAVIAHEIPQEIGDFAVLIHGGWKVRKALFYNFLSGLTAVLGALVVLIFARNLQSAPNLLLATAASSFIYIAMSDLIPELHKELSPKKSALQFLWFITGIGLMVLLLFLEH